MKCNRITDRGIKHLTDALEMNTVIWTIYFRLSLSAAQLFLGIDRSKHPLQSDY